MTGKRYLAVLLIVLAMVVSACGKEPDAGKVVQQTVPPVNTAENAPGLDATNPSGTNKPDTASVSQDKRPLPETAFLSSYPGVFISMSLTLEDIIKVLGTKFELYENSVQGYDVYQYSEYNLVFEYDRISEKISTIWLDNVPYYVSSGDIDFFDVDNDGKEEVIAAYEDEDLSGRVTVFSTDGVIKADQTTQYFDGKCDISFLAGYGSDKESLIILDTRAARDCEVFTYTNGKLISMIPPNQKDITKEATVELKDKTVFMNDSKEGIAYECPVPDALWQAYESDKGLLPDYRFAVNMRPIIKNNSLSLEIRHSLQLKLFEDPSQAEELGAYVDVAQILYEYQYLGSGKWQLLTSQGGPKYDRSNLMEGLTEKDFQVDSVNLLAPIESIAESLKLDLSQYSEYDLDSGMLIDKDGLCVGITNRVVSFLSLEKNSDRESFRGLKVLDTKQEALSLYGLPDKGYFDDSVWIYYFLREEKREDNSYPVIDSFHIEFEGDVVSKIWMAMYVSIY